MAASAMCNHRALCRLAHCNAAAAAAAAAAVVALAACAAAASTSSRMHLYHRDANGCLTLVHVCHPACMAAWGRQESSA